MTSSPTFIWPRACIRASRADEAVPVGERSILPGRMATACRETRRPLSFSTGPVNKQKVMASMPASVGWRNPICASASFTIDMPATAISRASLGERKKPSAAASTTTKLSPPKAISTVNAPKLVVSSVASRRSANDGILQKRIRSTLPLLHSAVTRTSPPGASSVNSVSGSRMGKIPVSSSTVATQIVFEPDMGGTVSGSIMIKPMSAPGCLGGTSRLA